jgi:formiminoglutamase
VTLPAHDDPDWPRASRWLAGESSPDAEFTLAVLGAPVARGSITPGRGDLTPAALREALVRFSTYDFETGGDLASLHTRDAGDLDVALLSPAEMFLPVRDAARAELDRADVLALLGGNNSITRAGVHALGAPLERCGLITFDAHLDLRDLGAGLTNGNPLRALLADGLPGANIVQIGLQPFANSRQYHEVAVDAGISAISADELRRNGIARTVGWALDRISERADEIYVDFDIDVLDRAYAPATPGSRPGGITPAELRAAARICGSHAKVRCADFVEVDPERDIAHATVYATCMCLLAFASGILQRPHATRA